MGGVAPAIGPSELTGPVNARFTQSSGPSHCPEPPSYCPERPNVISSEAEKSKPAVGSRGAIHTTRPRIEARCSATALASRQGIEIPHYVRNGARVGGNTQQALYTGCLNRQLLTPGYDS